MTTIETTAFYEDGVLRIAESLDLAEKSQVHITVHLPEPDDAASHHRQVHEALIQAGLSLPVARDQPLPAPLSDERRAELASLFSPDALCPSLLSRRVEKVHDRLHIYADSRFSRMPSMNKVTIMIQQGHQGGGL